MTIQEALDRVDLMRPNLQRKEFKIAALSELDGLIDKEIRKNHRNGSSVPATLMEIIANVAPEDREEAMEQAEEEEADFAGYTMDTDPDTVLIAPFPYDEIYLYWLLTKVDQQNLEMDKYANDRVMFNNAWDTLSDWWTRTHMPKQRSRQLWL